MNKISLSRSAWLGAACAALTLGASAIPAAAQNYPAGTNCQSLLPGLRANCIDQARQMNSGTNTIPNSAGANTVSPPGSLNTGTGVTAPNGTGNPNTVIPGGTVSPNAVTPNGTINPNAVQSPNGSSNQIIVPQDGGATDGSGSMDNGADGTGTGAGGTTN